MRSSLPYGFQYWVFLAFFISFAIKVPMFPFHTWLPAAHVEAPTAGSVLLASVLLKWGPTFPAILAADYPLCDAGVYALCAMALSDCHPLWRSHRAGANGPQKVGGLLERRSHGLRHTGIFALNQAGLEGAVLVMVNHGVTTGALFIVVGIIYERLHTATWPQRPGSASSCRFSPRSQAYSHSHRWRSRHEQFHRRVPGDERRLRGRILQRWNGDKNNDDLRRPGVVLAAAYMLRMLQKFAYGGLSNPDHSLMKDLGLREIATLAPLLVFVFWIGLHPEPFTRVMRASVKNVLKQLLSRRTRAPWSPPGSLTGL